MKMGKELKEIFMDIDRLEPSKIRGENFLNATQLFVYPLWLAFLLLVGLLVYERKDI